MEKLKESELRRIMRAGVEAEKELERRAGLTWNRAVVKFDKKMNKGGTK